MRIIQKGLAIASGCLIFAVCKAWAGPATLPYADDFETYTNQTPLINGLNGWYASSSDAIVQTNIVYTNNGGTKAAMIPIDVTLSNRFTGVPATSVWVRLYIRPVWYNGPTNPVVETNCATMFYVSNGFFVVHNGPATNPSPTNSQSWITITTNAAGAAATQLVDGAWTRVEVYLNYPRTNWTLYVNGDRLMTNIGFISNRTSFAGFDVYNGNSTSYQDNVYVTTSKTAVIEGLIASNKVYDGNTTAGINTNNLILVGIDPGDSVGLVFTSPSGQFDNKSVGERKTVTLTGFTLGGAQAANYSLVTTTLANIMASNLYLSGVTVSNKIYDGNATATISGTGTLNTAVGAEVVYLNTNSMSASFADKTTGAVKTVTISGIALAGTDNTNYTIASTSSCTASIFARTVTVINAVAANKAYDGTVAATVSGATLSNTVGGDTISLANSSTGQFATAWTGTNKTVTTYMSLSGADSGNYTLAGQPALTASITNLIITVGGSFMAANKQYDGNANATISSNGLTLVGVIGADDVTLTPVVVFSDASVGVGKTVSLTNSSSLGGTTASNYSLSLSGAPTDTADINKADRTVTFNPTSPQTYNTTNGLSATVSVSTGIWTFTVVSGPGQIVNSTNLWMRAAAGTVVVRATISEADSYNSASNDASVAAQAGAGGGGTNSIPWYDNFEDYYMQGTPLVNIRGWYASYAGCIVQTGVKYTGTQAALIPTDTVLSNRFDNAWHRVVRMELYVQPQLYNSSNYPAISSNVAAQFFISSNGYFVIADGSQWRELATKADGSAAARAASNYFARVQVNLRYKNHTWNLRAWSNNTDLIASTYYVNFTSNLNTFGGFDIYNGSATSYVDDVSVTNVDFNLLPRVNTVPVDIIKSINDAPPVSVNGERIDGRNE